MEEWAERGQEGFTLLELLIVMSILGILAVVAIPTFNQSIELANTSKVQLDLNTLNTAITLYQAEKGDYPSDLQKDLSDYVTDLDKLKPPQGDCLLRTGGTARINASSYSLSVDRKEALCQTYKAGDFGRSEKNSKPGA